MGDLRKELAWHTDVHGGKFSQMMWAGYVERMNEYRLLTNMV